MIQLSRRAAGLAAAAIVCTLLSACGGSSTSVNNNTSDTAVYYSQSLAFRNVTSLMSWGYNGYGQLGDNTTTNRSAPVRVLTNGEHYSGVSIGSNHVLAFLSDGTVRAWGYNAYGQLGTNSSSLATSQVPITVPGVNGATAVAAGRNFSLALANYSSVTRVVGWGRNDWGQLGDNSNIDTITPAPVQQATGSGLLPSDITQLVVGSDHCLALDSSNTIWSWGSDTYGQLGDSDSTLGDPTLGAYRAYAKPVLGISGTVTAIAAGGSTSFALTSDGTLWAWGYNSFGQLGVDPATLEKRSTPTPVAIAGTVTDIAAGLTHVVALMNDGTIMAWGGNIYGQIGMGQQADQQAGTNLLFSTPRQVLATTSPNVPLSGVTALEVVSGNHNVVRMSDGSLRAWGSNLFGQLGISAPDISPLPVAVTGFP